MQAVDERDAYANLLLPSLLRERGLSGRDAALATELTYGTLRGRGTYDAVLGMCSDRPVAKIDTPLLNVLRLGTHQLLGTRIPPHAAVGTAVDLARSVAGPGQAKFANAVLRKVAARDLEAWLAIVAPADGPSMRPAASRSCTATRAGSSTRCATRSAPGEIEDLLAADNERPRVTLVARPGRSTVAELGGEPAAYSPYAAYLAEGDPAAVPAVAEGRAAVQDEASQLVALALTRVPIEGRDERWLDLCAGPGGKAALLVGARGGARRPAARRRPPAAPRPARTPRVRRRPPRSRDGTRPAWRPGTFDRVLADVPCSGLGRAAPPPGGALAARPGDDRLAGAAAARPARLGARRRTAGRRGRLRHLLAAPRRDSRRGGRRAARARGRRAAGRASSIGGVPGLGDGPYAQFWPHVHGTDAMFLALLRRTA